LTGANSTGKTTLLNLIMGDYFSSKGQIRSFTKKTGVLNNCFYLRQKDVLFEELSVLEHFNLYNLLYGLHKKDIDFWIKAFELVANNKV
jgi:ABC-type multidrug transport system ATPase subunit